MPEAEPVGLLFIGDPHLASRVPGYRKDDYPRTILDKLKFALGYAKENRLVPVLLGDLFDFPRDNLNWVLVELHQLLERGTLAIYGNHDTKENSLSEHDSLSVLVASGHLRLLSDQRPWSGRMNGCDIVIGGTSWGQKLPESFDRQPFGTGGPSFVLWATHHDLPFPGYEEIARLKCREIPGIDLVVNGHIHRSLGEVLAGGTRWVNPGNIARIARGDATRAHVPAVLRVDVSPTGLALQRVEVPYKPFDEVFHEVVAAAPAVETASGFVTGLQALQSVRTATGTGLRDFLAGNTSLFEPRVWKEINQLADEVLNDAR